MSAWKLFIVIFFSVLLAIITSHFFMMSLALMGLSSVIDYFDKSVRDAALPMPKPAATSPAKDTPSPILDNDIIEQLKPKKEELQKQRAFENDVRLCASWRSIYAKEPTATYKMHLESACKRAYGKNWSY